MKVRVCWVTDEGLEKVLYWKFKSKEEFFTFIGRNLVGVKGCSYREIK